MREKLKRKAKLVAVAALALLAPMAATAQGALYCFYHGGTWYCLPWWWF